MTRKTAIGHRGEWLVMGLTREGKNMNPTFFYLAFGAKNARALKRESENGNVREGGKEERQVSKVIMEGEVDRRKGNKRGETVIEV